MKRYIRNSILKKGYNCTVNDFITFCDEEGYETPQFVFDLKQKYQKYD